MFLKQLFLSLPHVVANDRYGNCTVRSVLPQVIDTLATCVKTLEDLAAEYVSSEDTSESSMDDDGVSEVERAPLMGCCLCVCSSP